jgi:hypothetical protein
MRTFIRKYSNRLSVNSQSKRRKRSISKTKRKGAISYRLTPRRSLGEVTSPILKQLKEDSKLKSSKRKSFILTQQEIPLLLAIKRIRKVKRKIRMKMFLLKNNLNPWRSLNSHKAIKRSKRSPRSSRKRKNYKPSWRSWMGKRKKLLNNKAKRRKKQRRKTRRQKKASRSRRKRPNHKR